MRVRDSKVLMILLAASLLAFAACSDDDGDGDGKGPSETIEVPIVAAQGGTVSDQGGTVSLHIPPGALAEDTTITLSVLPASGGSISQVYDFGPDGLTFLGPTSLDIKVDAAKVGQGEAKVAIFEGGKWKALDDTSYNASKGLAHGVVEHFSRFSVILIGGGGGGGGGGANLADKAACEAAEQAFQPCGGSVEGTWSMELACFGTENFLDEDCPEATFSVEFPSDYRVNFQGGKITSQGSGDGRLQYSAPISCMYFNSCADADAFQKQYLGGSCSGTDVCTCEMPAEDIIEHENAAYRVEGNTLIITDSEGEDSYEYCVSGSKMSLRPIPSGDGDDDDDEEEDSGIIVLKRN